jgi:transcriptional regulator with XRE-family HTH domain
MPVRTLDHRTFSRAREAAGKSQTEAAAECGVSLRALSDHEAGRRPPKATTLGRYADAYGVDVSAFYTIAEAVPA